MIYIGIKKPAQNQHLISSSGLVALLLLLAGGSLAEATAGSPDIRLGVKTVRARPGETVPVFVYVNNFSDSLIRGCSFTVEPKDEFVLKVGGAASSDTDLVVRQGVIVSAQTIRFGVIRFSFEFADRPIGYGCTELVRFPVTPSFDPSYIGQRMYLTFKDIEIRTRGGSVIAADTVQRWLHINQNTKYPSVPGGNGNVDGIGQVTELDAMALLRVIVQGTNAPPGEFVDVNADVNSNSVIDILDAALILQYAYGIIPQLPVAQGPDSLGFGSSPEIRLSDPEQINAEAYRIRVIGSGVRGLISAEAEISLNTATVTSVKEVTSEVRGAKIGSLTDLSRGTCRLGLMTADALDRSDVTLFDLVVGVRAGPDMPQELVDSVAVFVNDYDRLLAVTGARQPLTHNGRNQAPHLTFVVRNGVVEARGPGAEEASLNIIDLAGRTVARGIPGGTAALPGASVRYVVGTVDRARARPALVIQSR